MSKIPEAEWYYALNDLNEVWGGPFGPGKKNAIPDIRALGRKLVVDGPFHLVPEGQVPEDANWYPE